MSHRAISLPVLLASASFFSVTPAATQVASLQQWGMPAERTEAEPEPFGPTIAPRHLWGMGAARNEGAVSSADRDALNYQPPRPRAPAPRAAAQLARETRAPAPLARETGAPAPPAPAPRASAPRASARLSPAPRASAPPAPAAAVNFAQADNAGIFNVFAPQGDPVEDDRGSAPNQTAWSRDAERTSVAGSEFMGAREERGSPGRQANGSFAAVSVPDAPEVAAADEALTVDVLRRNNGQATKSLAQNSVSYAPAADAEDGALTVNVLRRNNGQATKSLAQNSVSYAPAADAEDGALTVNVLRRNNGQATRSLAQNSVSYAPAAANETEKIAILHRNNKQATGSSAPVSVSYAPAVANEAVTVDILRRVNRQAEPPGQRCLHMVTVDILPWKNRPAIGSSAPASASNSPADEVVSVDVLRQNNRPATGSLAQNTVSYSRAVNATEVAYEASTADTSRPTSGQTSSRSDLMLALISRSLPMPPVPIAAPRTVAMLGPRPTLEAGRVKRGSKDVDLFGSAARNLVSYAPPGADDALTADILRWNNRQATGSFAPVSVSYAPAVADEVVSVDVLRRNNRPATGSFARNTVSYSRAVNTTVVADEASMADTETL